MERYIIIDNDAGISVVNKEKEIEQEVLEAVDSGDCIILCTKIIRIDEIQIRRACVSKETDDDGEETDKFVIDDWELVA